MLSSMASVCANCGRNLGMVERIARRETCGACVQDARRQYFERIAQIDEHTDVAAARTELVELAARSRLNREQLAANTREAFQAQIRDVVDDLLLTEDEERRIRRVMMVLDVDDDMLARDFKEDAGLLIAAKINRGWLPTIADPPMLLKRNEVPHLALDAELIKEVVHRETRTSFNGVSVRIARGVTYRVGEARSRSYVTGTSLEAADQGPLYVTSDRTVFVGRRNTIELPHSKLVSLDSFTDGIRVHVSNRKVPPMFKVETGKGWVLTALVNQAAQRLLA
jgi:hypothetical protein